MNVAASAESSAPGLSSSEANARLRQVGPNAVPEAPRHPWRVFTGKMWGTVPWMLEASILLELFLGKIVEAAVIGALVVLNAALGSFEELRSQDALTLLRQRLKLSTRVRRDGTWVTLLSEEIVPGDIVHLRLGDLVPADIRILEGDLLLDQSILTGESLPVEARRDQTCYAGTTIKHGEATGEVTATGGRTRFGKVADLVRQAKVPSRLERTVVGIVSYLIALDGLLALLVLTYAAWTGTPMGEVVPFTLMLLVASVPVALPATFTVATALGAQKLAHRGVLVTHLTAIEEAAGMDILCSDKTGTITENRLAVSTIVPYAPSTEADVLRLAAMACDDATQDPLDLAILQAARARNLLNALPPRHAFIPFDPTTKRSEATFGEHGQSQRVLKGAPHWIGPLCTAGRETAEQDERTMAARGERVLAIASGVDQSLRLAGLVGLQDPPRVDSPSLIKRLRELGVRVILVTGDGLATARWIAAAVGIGDRACAVEILRRGSGDPALACDLLGEVLPEDKFDLVHSLQDHAHTVGMTGDGVNDAPALRQAQVGIAVSNATDVAKAAAGLVLTDAGLGNIIAAIEESRCIYQRMLTYTLNKIVKTIQIALFLSLGFLLTGTFVTTPLLIVLLLFTNDFATMSIAADRVLPSSRPDRWRVRELVFAALSLAVPLLLLSFGILWIGRNFWQLSVSQMQTLIFVLLVFSGQGTIYLVRERRHLWSSRPGNFLLFASIADVCIVGAMAALGILMVPIRVTLIAATLGIIVAWLIVMDRMKIWIFRKLDLR